MPDFDPDAFLADKPAFDPDTFLAGETPATTIGEDILGGLETAATLASGISAEPLAGIAGIVQSINPFAEEGAGARAVEETRDALTYQGGDASQGQLASIGEALAPVGKALSGAETFLGDSVLDVTGSPALASIAHSLPTAALELIGLKGAKRFTGAPKGPTKKLIKQSILESAPEVEAIKNASRALYKEVDDSGVRIKPQSINSLVNRIEVKTRKKGLDPRVTKEASGAMDAIREMKNSEQPITELMIQKEIAGKVAGNANDAGQAMLGKIMIDEMDGFLDGLSPSDLSRGDATTGKKVKMASKLWGRAKRSEMITNAIELGERRAAGAEAGIRNELGNLINRKGSSKYITPDEKALIQDLVKGDFKQNFTRLIGKLGISIDRSPGVFQAMMASGSAGLGGLFGLGAGGIVIPVVGTVSKKIAQNLTRNKAKFVDSMSRAGTDANKITKAYLTAVPKSKRSSQDLADLLSDPKINLDDLEMIANQTFQDAVDLAKGKRAINLAVGALAGGAAQATKTEEQPQ